MGNVPPVVRLEHKTLLLILTRTGIGVLFSALTAALLLLAMPPYGLWPLALLGFVPMLVAEHRLMPRRLSGLAQAVGVGGFLGIYITRTFGPFSTQVAFLQALPFIIAGIVFLATQGARPMHERTHYRWFVAEGAFVWVGIEMIRNLVPSIGTGGFMGYAFFRMPWFIQPISLFGIFGLNLLILFAAHALALCCLALYDRSIRRLALFETSPATPVVDLRLSLAWLRGSAIAAAAWTAIALVMYLTPSPTAAVVRAAAIQPGERQSNDVDQVEQLSALSREAAAQGARLIVWPEGALDFNPKLRFTRELRALASESGAYLVIGYAYRTPNGNLNEVTVLSPGGEFLGVYGKDHPVTFVGETSVSGGTYPAYQTLLGALGSIICADLNYVDSARRISRNGAQILAVPSNDWEGLSPQQVAYLRYRSVENHVTAIKADTLYGSMMFDPRGRLLASSISSQPSRNILIADVPVGNPPTLYTMLGDWLGWLSLAGLVFFSVPNPLLKGKKELEPSPAPLKEPVSHSS